MRVTFEQQHRFAERRGVVSNVRGEVLIVAQVASRFLERPHVGLLDDHLLFRTLHPQLHVLYKAELHKFPIMGTVLDVGGYVPIERGNRERAMASIGRGAASLRLGVP